MIKSTIMTVDLEHPARWCSMYDSFLHWKVTLSFLSLHTVPSGKEPTVCSSNHPLGWSTYINYLKTFHTCPSCVNVFHHFCVSLTNSWTFIFFLGFFFGCAGSSLLCFLVMRQAGATLHCGARALHCSGFSCCGTWAIGWRASAVAACRP